MSFLSSIGWSPGDLEHLPHNRRPARITRVDRGLLTFLTEDGERRVRAASALRDGDLTPVAGDWVALDGERVIAVLPRRTAFVRTVAGRTAALVGPLRRREVQPVNALAGRTVAATREARDVDGRGRHTTTARELHVLPGGGLLVDTPGMRELALFDDADWVATAYADVEEPVSGCRFRDCGHRPELARGGEDGVL